jgi:Domain of unknown function (DUF222)/HNH endonuclease
VSLGAARVLVQAREANAPAFDRSEETLVEAARRHSVAELQRAAAVWRERVAQHADPVVSGSGLRDQRRLHASVTFQGMVRLDGDLDPEPGETVLTALAAEMDAEVKAGAGEQGRTAAQRRADALDAICRFYLDRSDRPTVGGERPHVTMTVAAETVARWHREPLSMAAWNTGSADLGAGGGLGGEDVLDAGGPELDHVGPISTELARQLTCDASVRRIVMAGRSQPLDVGRQTQVVPAPIRRAVIARDRRCRFPGCDRPPPWSDCHHVVHWGDGGDTALSNLLLLCRAHHRLVHDERRGFGLELDDGLPVFRRPDGTVLEDRAPP